MTTTHLRLAVAADFELAEKLLEALEQTNLEFDTLVAVEIEPFSDEQSLRFQGKSVEQIKLADVDWSAFNYVFFAAPMLHAETLAAAVQAGCIVLDLYGITALIQGVPVVVPSVNDEALLNLRERNIVALANPQISQLALALKSVADQPISQIVVSSLLPASYFGSEKIHQLAGQTARLLNGINLDEETERVAFDCVPASHQLNSKAQPFAKLVDAQFAKIFPNLTANLVLHSVQVPVFYGLSQQVSLLSEYELNPETLSNQWQAEPWLKFHTDNVITAVKSGEENNEEQAPICLHISQLLRSGDNRLQFWSVADEQKFSLAFLAVALLERVLQY